MTSRVERLVTLLVVVAFSPFVIESVNTCWSQGPSDDLLNCTSLEDACEQVECSGEDDVCYFSSNNESGSEARGCLARDFAFGLVNETWKICEIPSGSDEVQCLSCCQTDGCNAARITEWPEAVTVETTISENNSANGSGNGTVEGIPMIIVYASAGGGAFLIILIILLVIYCMIQIAKRKRLKQVIVAMNKRRAAQRDRSLMERAGETVAETTGGVFKTIGGIFGFGEEPQDTKPMVEEPIKKKGSLRSRKSSGKVNPV